MAHSHEDRMKFLKSKRGPFKVEFACLLDNYDEETPVTNIGVWLEDSEDEFISFIKSQVELNQMDVVHSAPMILTLRDVIEKNVLTHIHFVQGIGRSWLKRSNLSMPYHCYDRNPMQMLKQFHF